MKNLLNPRLAVGLFLLFIVAIASATIWVTRGSSNDVDRIRVKNKTSSLVVESIKDLGQIERNSRFEITVKNGYDKPIIAYRLRVTDISTDKNTIGGVERDGFMDGWSLLPNGADTIRVSAASKGEIVLTIVAVMFENGTGDGIAEDLQRLQEIRAGVKMAYQQIIPILRRAANTDASFASIEVVQSLENEISSISDKEVPMNLKTGFVEAKNYVNQELQDLRNKSSSESSFNINAQITKKLAKFEETLAKL